MPSPSKGTDHTKLIMQRHDLLDQQRIVDQTKKVIGSAHGTEARNGRVLIDTSQMEQTQRSLINNDIEDWAAPLTRTHQEGIGFDDLEEDAASKISGKVYSRGVFEEDSEEEETEGQNSGQENSIFAREKAAIKDKDGKTNTNTAMNIDHINGKSRKRRKRRQSVRKNLAENGTDSDVQLDHLPFTEVQTQAVEDEEAKTKWYPLSHLNQDDHFTKLSKEQKQLQASELVKKLSSDNADYFCGK